MKAVMISIRPEWCEKIAQGKKTFEIRKTSPKLQPSFKCYIYCTETGNPLVYGDVCNGHIMGEFVCDYILDIRPPYGGKTEGTCLEAKELYTYAGAKPLLYGWHITKLKIYDKPKELSEFRRLEKTKEWAKPQRLTRPPQSWCYVEELT